MLSMFPLGSLMLDEILEDDEAPSIVNQHTLFFALFDAAYVRSNNVPDRVLFQAAYKAVRDYAINYNHVADLELAYVETSLKALRLYAHALLQAINIKN